MKPNTLFFSILGALYAGVFLTCTVAFAQTTPEEQAKSILLLFESGQKDTAYALLEPLKQSARFSPAVIYTRAQMTPDDRALNLYKEIIALDPGGPWSDKAAFQLVNRYADKRDSLAAYTWGAVLKNNYPNSTFAPEVEKLLTNVTEWRAEEDEPTEPLAGKKPVASQVKSTQAKSVTKSSAKITSKPGSKDAKPVKSTEKPTSVKSEPGKGTESNKGTETAPTETFKATGMNGWALQVAVFPTKDLAVTRMEELRKRNIRAFALPKPSAGKGHYAVVIGTYTTKEEATKKKPTVNELCDCKSFLVQVK